LAAAPAQAPESVRALVQAPAWELVLVQARARVQASAQAPGLRPGRAPYQMAPERCATEHP
jgi:hypothetical protein